MEKRDMMSCHLCKGAQEFVHTARLHWRSELKSGWNSQETRLWKILQKGFCPRGHRAGSQATPSHALVTLYISVWF